jgi:hypothetical protein
MDRGAIVEKAELGGLHHRYERLAAMNGRIFGDPQDHVDHINP